MTQLETLLSEIPEHCREAIIKLPVRELLNLYQYHTAASHHGLQKQWQIAIAYEQHAIKGFQALLPTNRDHYIFFNFYSILSALFLGLGEVQAAIEGIYISLAILLIHTPMDYPTISNHYYYLAEAYQCKQNWKSTAQYLAKAIETARLSNDLDQEYIRTLETKLRIAK
jgi:tetratricopeptide (TPR) repeat protein